MATTSPRVQVTALCGAQAEHEDREREEEAIQYLIALADGAVDDIDFDALREVHAERERSV
jgi:hypothetical protein